MPYMDEETEKNLKHYMGEAKFNEMRSWLNEAFDAGYQHCLEHE